MAVRLAFSSPSAKDRNSTRWRAKSGSSATSSRPLSASAKTPGGPPASGSGRRLPSLTTRRPRYFSVTRMSPSGVNARLHGCCRPETSRSRRAAPWITSPAAEFATACSRGDGSAASTANGRQARSAGIAVRMGSAFGSSGTARLAEGGLNRTAQLAKRLFGATNDIGGDAPLQRKAAIAVKSWMLKGCVPCGGSTFRHVDGQAALRGFLVDRLHVVAGLAHGRDHLVERNLVRAVAAQREPRRVDRLDRAHRITLDAGNLHEARDRVAGEAEVVLHADLGCVLDLRVRGAEGGREPGRRHRAGDA